MSDKLTFQAEVIEVKSRKTASLDISYRVILQTGNPAVLALGAIDASTLLNVEVEPES